MGMNENCWASVTFAYKFYFISSLITLVFFLITSSYIFVDMPALTVFQLQLWRIFFAFYGQVSFMGIISILFAFLWMSRLIPATVHLLLSRKNNIPQFTQLLTYFCKVWLYILPLTSLVSYLYSCLKVQMKFYTLVAGFLLL